jgi:hypothetical protein
MWHIDIFRQKTLDTGQLSSISISHLSIGYLKNLYLASERASEYLNKSSDGEQRHILISGIFLRSMASLSFAYCIVQVGIWGEYGSWLC